MKYFYFVIAFIILLILTAKKIMGRVVIPEKLKPIIYKMIADALKDNVRLSVGSGLRTFDEQLALRKNHVIDKSKANDIEYLKTAPNTKFNPVTAKPGTSNHESGLAIDFNVTGNNEAYLWLVKNAHAYGFVRTVPSERWHWEYRPSYSMYAFVPRSHETWTVG